MEDRAADISGPVLPHDLIDGPATAPLRTFRSDAHEEAFRTEGFTVLDVCDQDVRDELLAIWASVGPAPGDPQTGFFPGNASPDPAWKRDVIAAALPIVWPLVEPNFVDHHPFHLTFMAKWPGPGGRLQPHQDSTMVGTESRQRALNVWIPLNDEPTDAEAMGMLRIVPRSHELPSAHWYRARGGFIPAGIEEVEQLIDRSGARPVPTRPGQAIAFDHRVIHCSSPNRTDRPRLVLAIGVRPAQATNVHVECDPEGWVDLYEVDDEYFVLHPEVDISTYPRRHRFRRALPPWVAPAGDGLRPTPETEARLAAPMVLRARSDFGPPTGTGPVAQGGARRLRRDGFARVGSLPAAALAEARALVDHTGAVADPDRLDQLVARLVPGSPGTWSTAHRSIELAPATVDPDAGVPPHVLRSMAAAPGEATWSLFVPLDDATGDRGLLRLVRGSHRIDPGVRPAVPGAPPPSADQRWADRMVDVPLRAGEGLVASPATVRARRPNHGGEAVRWLHVRLAPTGASVGSWWEHDEETVRFEPWGGPPDWTNRSPLDDACPPLPGASDAEVGRALHRLDRQALSLLQRVRRRPRPTDAGGSSGPGQH
ncbi:MAG: phytanoyl-CoA dioxygenase family protein [Acidimicrobiales bacterium]